MTIISELFADRDMRGAVQTNVLLFHDRERYKRVNVRDDVVKAGVSSIRGYAAGGHGHIYAFTEPEWLGKHVLLNLTDRHRTWIASLDPADDGKIDHALLVARNPSNEVMLDLGPLFRPTFTSTLDHALAGSWITHDGEPLVFTHFWPGHDPHKIFVSLYHALIVDVPDYPFDYKANVRYDVELYLTAERRLDAYVKWTGIWVEGGLHAVNVSEHLKSWAVTASYAVTAALRDKLSLWHSFRWQDHYLLPGPRPSSPFPERRDARTGSTLVLVY